MKEGDSFDKISLEFFHGMNQVAIKQVIEILDIVEYVIKTQEQRATVLSSRKWEAQICRLLWENDLKSITRMEKSATNI